MWTRSPSIAPAFAQEKAGDPISGSDGLPRSSGAAAIDERLAQLESLLRTSPSEPRRVADFVIDAMTADQRSSDDIVVLAARRQAADPGLI